jgi:hypothetical protein
MNEAYTVFDCRGTSITSGKALTPTNLVLEVAHWPSGLYVVAFDQSQRVRFSVIH